MAVLLLARRQGLVQAACRLLGGQGGGATAPWQQLQQQAGFAKKGESVDNRLQRVMKMLEPRQVEQVELSEEDYQEGMRRCVRRAGVGGVGRRRRAAAATGGTCRLQHLLLQPADSHYCCTSPPCPRRHKEYSRKKMAEHRAWQADLTQKLKLKQAAVAALPPELRAAAEVRCAARPGHGSIASALLAPVEEEEAVGQDEQQC